VNGISNHKSNIGGCIPVAKVMFDNFVSASRIYLDGGNVSIWQTGDSIIDIVDVLSCPVDLKP